MKGSNKYPTLSLYRHFEPGDRVRRTYHGGKDNTQEIEGIILTMDHDRLEIYWDTIDGMYCPDLIKDDFTLCFFDEVIYGTETYSPVKSKKSIRL